MTITFAWWILPTGLVLLGILLFVALANRAGDYDMTTPVIALGVCGICVALALGLVLGRLVF